MTYLDHYRRRIAYLERQVALWKATAEEYRRQRDDARTALADMHRGYVEQQAEIARLQAVERSAYRADL